MEQHRSKTGEKITYDTISEATGISKAALSRMASQSKENPYLARIDTLEKLCKFFHCTFDDLLERKSLRQDWNAGLRLYESRDSSSLMQYLGFIPMATATLCLFFLVDMGSQNVVKWLEKGAVGHAQVSYLLKGVWEKAGNAFSSRTGTLQKFGWTKELRNLRKGFSELWRGPTVLFKEVCWCVF